MTSSKNRAAYFRDGIIAPAGGSGVKAVAAKEGLNKSSDIPSGAKARLILDRLRRG